MACITLPSKALMALGFLVRSMSWAKAGGRYTSAPAIRKTNVTPSFTVRVCDISAHGCRCEFVDRPTDGEQVLVKFDGLEALPATARWIDPPLTGLKFHRPIHPAVFDLLLARLGG